MRIRVRSVVSFRLPAAFFCILLLSSSAPAQKWKFLVYGDSRGESTDSQINTQIVAELAKATVKEKPVFVLISGDIVDSGTLEAFTAWKHLMTPVYEAGIKVYPIIGNHDAVAVSAFVSVFGDDIPDNGPAGETDRTYAITYSNALVFALDTYVARGKINQVWVDSILATNTKPIVFAFGHMPAFKVHHMDTLDDYPANRDDFWRCLERVNCKAYFCGHDHFYDHMRLDDGDGNPDNDVHQYIVGTAGAPLYSDAPYDGDNGAWTPQRVFHERQYGYLVVEVDGLKVKTIWKHRVSTDHYAVNQDITSFHISPPPPASGDPD